MVKKILLFALAVSVLASCDDIKVKYDTNEKQRATMDLLVGDYELTEIGWDGGAIDLDGDGEALDFAEEYHQVVYDDAEVNVDRGSGDDELQVSIKMPVCQVALNGSGLSDSYFISTTIYGYIKIERDGSYTVRNIREVFYGSGGNYENEFDHISLEFSGETEIKLTATTLFPDYISGTTVTGMITMRFKCVSGKGKKK